MVGTPAPSDDAAALQAACALIAHELLDVERSPTTVGEITLHPHQRRAVSRVKTLLRVAGGAMVADATGLGKTFIALAIAADVEQTLIIAPAALLDAWRSAATRAAVATRLVSIERLSRERSWSGPAPDLVIVDEAHHLRNPCTRRYAAVAELCDRAQVLLLSATPLQNRRDDLVTQLALFLGDRARTATDEDLARLIVRRNSGDVGLCLPAVSGPTRVELSVNDDLLDELLSLPPPLPGRDEGEATTLLKYTLLRQWSSSRAALVGALRRRLAKAVALTSSLESGQWPSRNELMAWSCIGDAVQLAMPELLSPLGGGGVADIHKMLDAVRAHARALSALLARLRATADPDPARAAALEQICHAHTGARVIAFSQYAETVAALSRLLMPRRAGVAELTARGSRVAGGRISRREVLEQFAPRASSGSRDVEQISLLITTDVLSEGLDLQRASVVVHLDLPWNPARLEQRVGRVRRLGSTCDMIFVYSIAPPASSERVLRVESRLRAKLGVASRIVGLDWPLLADLPMTHPVAPPELTSGTLAALDSWRGPALVEYLAQRPVYAGTLALNNGLLVLMAVGDERILLAALDGGELSLDGGIIARAIGQCHGPSVIPTDLERAESGAAIDAWRERSLSRRRIALASPAGARIRARVSLRITDLLRSASRHERATLAPLASRARLALGAALGAGAERALAVLADSREPSAQWLAAVATLAEHRQSRSAAPNAMKPVAVIVLRRSSVTA